MKKIFLFALGMASLLCGCDSSTVEEQGNKMSATGFVGGLGNVTTTVSYYDFKEEDPGCEISGFSDAEGFGRWTKEETCNILFDNITPNSDLTAKILVTMSIPGGDEPTKYEAYVGNTKVGYGETWPGVVFVNIPSGVVGDNDKLELTIKILNPKRPIDVNPNRYDSRLLGMGISSITLSGISFEEAEMEDEED